MFFNVGAAMHSEFRKNLFRVPARSGRLDSEVRGYLAGGSAPHKESGNLSLPWGK